jgi:hypothetical protein
VGLLQTGLGIGSTLVLVPHELARIFGAEPRDVLVGIPPGQLDIAAELYAGLASADPNCLQPRVYRFDGETVQVGTLG